MNPDALLYPRDNPAFDDVSFVRTSVWFGTRYRAREAQMVLDSIADDMDPLELAFSAVNAFAAEMTAAEDTLGWLFALRDWRPGEGRRSLLTLLNTVQVGTPRYSEERARQILNELDEAGLRTLLHLPNDIELAEAGFTPELRATINRAIPAHLGGLRRIAEQRWEGNRTRVAAFNKIKHFMLARAVQDQDGTKQVLIVDARLQDDGFHLKTLTLGLAPSGIRAMAARALASQAVLNSLLGLILMFRFGEPYESPAWVQAAGEIEIPGMWAVEESDDEEARDP